MQFDVDLVRDILIAVDDRESNPPSWIDNILPDEAPASLSLTTRPRRDTVVCPWLPAGQVQQRDLARHAA